MADSKSNPSNPASGEKEVKVKAPNFIGRAKEEFEAIMHHKKSDSHHKETSGLKTNNSKEKASLDDVRAPNVFQRAKEEFEAIGQVLHHKKDSPTHDKRDETKEAKVKDKQEISGSPQEKNTKKANVFERAKEEIDAFIHHDKSPHRHHKETHGRSDDIDENTPKDEVKGPNVFERVKEEIEAVVQAIHPKK
ncbi:hypothetical protein QN277_007336 [Acacia crassicarpa]|uniref:Uncharacterized protein n=1 Tax=Acacia crassicarpa TaxID=499986 RepID=A0AAE1MCW9_9FABA|nr:hypothetical protein QN277_007336 [Acacia crassicarpa]